MFNETKGRARIAKTHELPILPPLRRSIDATSTGHLVYLVTAYDQPHSVKGFGDWFKDRCREAGLAHLSAHGLRKLAAQCCAEAGATEHQLMAPFGWTTSQQAEVYTRQANRKKLEAAAAMLLGRAGPEARNRNENAEAIAAIPEQVSNRHQKLTSGLTNESCSAKWQRATCPGLTSRNKGASRRQRSSANRQRV